MLFRSIQTLQIGSGLEQQNNVGAGAFYGLCPTLESVSINSPHALGRGSRVTKQLPWYQYNFSLGPPSLRGDYIYSGLHFTRGPLRLEGYLGRYSHPAYQYQATNQDSASVEQCVNLTSISLGDAVISIGEHIFAALSSQAHLIIGESTATMEINSGLNAIKEIYFTSASNPLIVQTLFSTETEIMLCNNIDPNNNTFTDCINLFADNPIEDAEPAAPAAQTVSINGNPSAIMGSSTTVTVNYDVTDSNNRLTGLGLNIHYDDSVLSYVSNTLNTETAFFAFSDIVQDTDDLDGNLSTNQIGRAHV